MLIDEQCEHGLSDSFKCECGLTDDCSNCPRMHFVLNVVTVQECILF